MATLCQLADQIPTSSCWIQKFTIHFKRVLQIARHLQSGFVPVCTLLPGSQVEQSPPCCLLYWYRVESLVPSAYAWGTLFHKTKAIPLGILEDVFSRQYHTTWGSLSWKVMCYTTAEPFRPCTCPPAWQQEAFLVCHTASHWRLL